MHRWQTLRDPIATLVFGLLTIAVSTGAIPDTIDRNVILEIIGAVMTIAAGVTSVLQRKGEAGAPQDA